MDVNPNVVSGILMGRRPGTEREWPKIRPAERSETVKNRTTAVRDFTQHIKCLVGAASCVRDKG
jgi:hypothetical protein